MVYLFYNRNSEATPTITDNETKLLAKVNLKWKLPIISITKERTVSVPISQGTGYKLKY